MPRILLLLAVIAVIYILYRQVGTLPPHKRRAQYVKLGLAIAAAIVLLLTLTGKMHWLGALLTGALIMLRQLLPTLVRLFPMLASSIGQRKAAAAGTQQSTVETALLRMHLAHDSGEMDGDVLDGPFKDWRLSEMNQEQLLQFLNDARTQDQDSAALLESYLEQRFGADFETGPTQSAPADNGQMTRSEALAVLGLGEDAERDDIIAAHRKLMQKIHPDRGGSDYLAAKINQAKDLLLGS